MKLSVIPMLLSLTFGFGSSASLMVNASDSNVTYFVNKPINSEFGAFENVLSLDKGYGESVVSRWLNDTSYVSELPVRAITSSDELSLEQSTDLSFLLYLSTRYLYTYAEESEASLFTSINDFVSSECNDFLSILHSVKDDNVSSSNTNIHSYLTAFHTFLNDVLHVDSGSYFSSFRNYLFNESTMVKAEMDLSFDSYSFVRNYLESLTKDNVSKTPFFLNGLDEYYSNVYQNEYEQIGLSILADYLGTMDQAHFDAFVDQFYPFVNDTYTLTEWKNLSLEEMIQSTKLAFAFADNQVELGEIVYSNLDNHAKDEYLGQYIAGNISNYLVSFKASINNINVDMDMLDDYLPNLFASLNHLLDSIDCVSVSSYENAFNFSYAAFNGYEQNIQTNNFVPDSLAFVKEYYIGRLSAAAHNDRVGDVYKPDTLAKLKSFIQQINSFDNTSAVLDFANLAVKDINSVVNNYSSDITVIDSNIGRVLSDGLYDQVEVVATDVFDDNAKNSLNAAVENDYGNNKHIKMFNLSAFSNRLNTITTFSDAVDITVAFDRPSCWNINVYRYNDDGTVDVLRNGPSNRNGNGEYISFNGDSIVLHTVKIGNFAIAYINRYFEVEIANNIDGVSYTVVDSTSGTTLSPASVTKTDNIYEVTSLHDLVVTFQLETCYAFKNPNDSVRIVKAVSKDMMVGVPSVNLVHTYNGGATYSWNNERCTATILCSICGDNGKISETKTGTYVKDVGATCVDNEKGHYEVEFNNVHFTKQVSGYATIEGNEKAFGHHFVDGECTNCHLKEPNSKERLTLVGILTIVIVSLLALIIVGLVIVLIKKNKKSAKPE